MNTLLKKVLRKPSRYRAFVIAISRQGRPVISFVVLDEQLVCYILNRTENGYLMSYKKNAFLRSRKAAEYIRLTARASTSSFSRPHVCIIFVEYGKPPAI